MSKKMAYVLVVKFNKIKCKYYNNFISLSKCKNVTNGLYDNGRVISADSLELTLTDIDFYFILDTYKIESYEIKEAYYTRYDYLHKDFIEFILEKYVKKTKYKGVEGLEVEYSKEKSLFNALYGMSVTNTIRENVFYDTKKDWYSKDLTNNEILEKLQEEKKAAFLSFAYGVWITAYARNNLLRNVIKLDEYVIYCDTDSMKLKKGYDIEVIKYYNNFVENKIKAVSKILNIDINKYEPSDINREKKNVGCF